jgi:hypothetical protein
VFTKKQTSKFYLFRTRLQSIESDKKQRSDIVHKDTYHNGIWHIDCH